MIVHFARKADLGVYCPNPRYTYELTKAGFKGKEVWVIPEWEGNLNLTARIEWLAGTFSGIPLVIDVFEGGENPTPSVKMTIADLEQIMRIGNVTAIRIPELISWYLDREIDDSNVWIDWVHSMFDFALSHNLNVYWSEWKLGPYIEPLTNATLAGYEDKITYLYQTNNQYQHPMIGYVVARQYPHWGASVQGWWVDKQDAPHDNLPLRYVELYATLARNLGAETIEFEPYWYFFENGEPKASSYAMWSII